MSEDDTSKVGGARARFSRLELPESSIDWSFLDLVADLPRPLPVEEHRAWVAVQGRVFVPAEGSEPVEGSPGEILLYDLSRSLRPLDAPGQLERRWWESRAAALDAARRAFLARLPVALLQDEALVARALAELEPPAEEIPDKGKALQGAPSHEDGSDWLALVGHSRLLSLDGKLYNLLTLHEYAAIFARALGERVTAAIRALSGEATPEAFLAAIERHLDDIHPKARSPLRNKMSTSRLRLWGISLLPVYTAPSSGLYDRYAQRLSRALHRSSLERRVV